jgi:hypothetical protein
MKKYFYEKNNLTECSHNISFHELLQKNGEELEEWIDGLRSYIVDTWDNLGLPPRTGKNEKDIIGQFNKLQRYDTKKFLHKDEMDGTMTIVKNFNKFATVIDQFFPTMLKTKIGSSKHTSWSVYDCFASPEKRESFHTCMRRTVRRDSFYTHGRTICINDPDVPYETIDGESWVREFSQNKASHPDNDFWIIELFTEKKFDGYEADHLMLTAKQIKSLYKDGCLETHNIRNLERTASFGDAIENINDVMVEDGKEVQFKFSIRYYDKTSRIFPSAMEAFKLGLSQPAVNFPPLTAKYIYQKYTDHVGPQTDITIYDPSSGWGGRILGAMSIDDRQIHYVGTDPNTDNYIDEIGKSRYEYAADFFNEKTNGGNPFFGHRNTYDVYQDGSEDIHKNPNFKKYKGKLDLVFTSPPYFNREQYSADESQSFKKFPKYEDWRDNFLRPTLKTAAEYLRHDRYLIWNIADIADGNGFMPLEQDSKDILAEHGLEYVETLKMLMTTMRGVKAEQVKNCCKIDGELQKYEPIFVFYKK